MDSSGGQLSRSTFRHLSGEERGKMFKLLRRLMLGLSAVSIGVAAGLSNVAFSMTACTVHPGTPRVYEGDSDPNVCNGTSGFDSFYGYGNDDELGGLDGMDRFRGATGNDVMTDGQGNGDNDRSCDGDGFDYVQFQDGDDDDIGHFVIGDGFTDPYQSNQNDGLQSYSANNCPLPNDL